MSLLLLVIVIHYYCSSFYLSHYACRIFIEIRLSSGYSLNRKYIKTFGSLNCTSNSLSRQIHFVEIFRLFCSTSRRLLCRWKRVRVISCSNEAVKSFDNSSRGRTVRSRIWRFLSVENAHKTPLSRGSRRNAAPERLNFRREQQTITIVYPSNAYLFCHYKYFIS